MPAVQQVKSLQSSSQCCLITALQRLFYSPIVSFEELNQVINILERYLPPQSIQKLCEGFLAEYLKEKPNGLLNEKYLYFFIYIKSKLLYLIELRKILYILQNIDGSNIVSLYVHNIRDVPAVVSPHSKEFEEKVELEDGSPFYKFVSTLGSLRYFSCYQIGDDAVLKVLSKSCPHLEEVIVRMTPYVTDQGLCYLSGCCNLNDGVVHRKYLLSNLKKVVLEFTMACAEGTAMLLKFCENLEFLDVTPDVNMCDVFVLLHGHDSEKYEYTKKRYKLKKIHITSEADESVLALIAKTCPDLEEITLRCYGVERCDKNLLAVLLSVPLKKVRLLNCHSESLMWFLEKCGYSLHELTVQHLISAPPTVTFSRTNLQQVIGLCPNLSHFTLKLSGGLLISPDVPYSDFGSNVLYFKSLTHLILESVSLDPQDLIVFISKCHELQELIVMCLQSDIINDSFIFDVLAKGSLKKLRTLYLYRPLLTLAGLLRILSDCSSLRKVGPLSSWALSQHDRKFLSSEIKRNNWDLNVNELELHD